MVNHIIGIRTPESEAELAIIVGDAKYNKIKQSIKEGKNYSFKLTKKEIELTQELNEAHKGGSILGTIASIGIPLIGSLFGKIFKGGRIYLSGNKGGKIDLGGQKKIPTFSAEIR